MAKRLRPGQARVEFLAIKAEILNLVEKGHSIKAVHELLAKNNKITMAYPTLRKFIMEPRDKEVKAKCKKQTSSKQIIAPIDIEGTKASKLKEISKEETKSAQIAIADENTEIAKTPQIALAQGCVEAEKCTPVNIIDVNEQKTDFANLNVDGIKIF